MNIADPQYWHLFWLIPILGLFFRWSARERRMSLQRFAEPNLLEGLISGVSRIKPRMKEGLYLAFLCFLFLALVRPQWGTKMETVKRKGVDIMVVLDTSLSMETQDVSPNRLEKAKHEVRVLLDALQGDRVGLVVFAGMSQVNCPLTIDQNAVKLFLDNIDTQVISQPGTNIGDAIRTAVRGFNQLERRYKVLILVTDGENLEGDPVSAAEEAQKAGVVVYAMGVGTGAGQPIPIRDEKGAVTGYKKDESGSVVVSRLDEATLEAVARATGGKYFRATTGEEEIDKILSAVSQMDRKELQSKVYMTFVDRFQIPLGIALLLIVVESMLGDERRVGRRLRIVELLWRR